MKTVNRAVLVVALWVSSAALSPGCSSLLKAEGPDVTGGVTLELFAQRGEDSFALYAMTADGMLHFAGGLDAYERKFSWSGQMTEEEIERMGSFLDEQDWWHVDPASTRAPQEHVYRVKVRKPGFRRSFEVTGDGAGITPLYELLETAARRRHAEYLEMMPEPGPQSIWR